MDLNRWWSMFVPLNGPHRGLDFFDDRITVIPRHEGIEPVGRT